MPGHTDAASSRLADGQRLWKVGFSEKMLQLAPAASVAQTRLQPSPPVMFDCSRVLLIMYFRSDTYRPLVQK